MSKRNVTFTKPEEPSFLKKLKAQISYKEGPSVDTKRLDLGPAEDLPDREDEQPTVVVLEEGDLTAEEAEVEAAKIAEETGEAPSDSAEKIVFRKPSKSSKNPVENIDTKKTDSRSKKKQKPNKSLLSFDEEEDDC